MFTDKDDDDFFDWELWFERGSWFVLFAGIGGTAARALTSIYFILLAPPPVDQAFQFGRMITTVGQGFLDLAIVVSLFLLLRLLLLAVLAMLELRDSVIFDDEEDSVEKITDEDGQIDAEQE